MAAARRGAVWLALAASAQAFAAAPPKPALAPPVAAAAASAPAGNALDRREIRAQLTPRRYTTLAAEIGAKVNRLPVAEGGRFKAGEVLIVFDCVLQQAQLNKARATQDAAEKAGAANRRLDELHSIGKVELEVSESEIAKAKADVAAYAAMMSKCSVAAPYAGRVAEQKVREQQYVQPGQALLEILDDSALELEFIVPSRWLAWIRPNQPFQVAIDETGRSYPAKVQRIGARVDPVSQSVKLSAVIDGHFPELIAGMSGKVLMAP